MLFACSSIFCTRNGSDFTAVRLEEVASSIFVLSNFAICSKHSFSSRLVTIVNPLQLSESKQHQYARLVQPLPPNLSFSFTRSVSCTSPLHLVTRFDVDKRSWDMHCTHV